MLNLFFFLANDKNISDHLSLHMKQIYFYVIESIFMLEKGANCNFILRLILKYISTPSFPPSPPLYLRLRIKNAKFW